MGPICGTVFTIIGEIQENMSLEKVIRPTALVFDATVAIRNAAPYILCIFSHSHQSAKEFVKKFAAITLFVHLSVC